MRSSSWPDGYQLVTRWLFMLTASAVLVASTSTDDRDFRLFAVDSHVAYSRDLVVNYSLPDNYHVISSSYAIHLVSFDSTADRHRHIVASASIPPPSGDITSVSGHVAFGCELVRRAGRYAARIVEISAALSVDDSTDSENDTLQSVGYAVRVRAEVVIDVTWPRVTLSVARTTYAAWSDEGVTVGVSKSARLQCGVELLSLRLCRLTSAGCDVTTSDYVISGAAAMHQSPAVFTCDALDRRGRHRVELVSADNDIIAASDVFHIVEPAVAFRLFPPSHEDVYGCQRHVTVRFQRPVCSTGSDKVRMYRRRQLERSADNSAPTVSALDNSLQPLNVQVYVAEQRVEAGRDTVAFDCQLLEDVYYSEDVDDSGDVELYAYCFKYISMAHNNAVREEHVYCLSPSPASEPVDGGFSEWSAWSDCSSSCRDGATLQTRFRSCDRPSPSNGGRLCTDGHVVETRDCRSHCSLEVESTRAPPTSSPDYWTTPSPVSDADCDTAGCHCTVNAALALANTTLAAAGGSGNCTAGARQWTVLANDSGAFFRLRLHAAGVDSAALVLVRDGASPLGNLLWSSSSAARSAPTDVDAASTVSDSQVVVSSGPSLTIVYVAPRAHPSSFLALLTVENVSSEVSVDGGSAVIREDDADVLTQLLSGSDVVLIGIIVLLVVLIVVALSLAVSHSRLCVRRPRRAATTTTTSAATTTTTANAKCPAARPAASPSRRPRKQRAGSDARAARYDQNLRSWNHYNAADARYYVVQPWPPLTDPWYGHRPIVYPYSVETTSSDSSTGDDAAAGAERLLDRQRRRRRRRRRRQRAERRRMAAGDQTYLSPAALRQLDAQYAPICGPSYYEFCLQSAPPPLPLVLGPESLYDERLSPRAKRSTSRRSPRKRADATAAAQHTDAMEGEAAEQPVRDTVHDPGTGRSADQTPGDVEQCPTIGLSAEQQSPAPAQQQQQQQGEQPATTAAATHVVVVDVDLHQSPPESVV